MSVNILSYIRTISKGWYLVYGIRELLNTQWMVNSIQTKLRVLGSNEE